MKCSAMNLAENVYRDAALTLNCYMLLDVMLRI